MTSIGSVNIGSIAMELAALRQEQRAAQLEVAEHDIAVQTQEQTYQREKQIEAERRAAEEAKDASAWGDVASIAKGVAVVGSVAAAAFTGGSSLIVAASIAGGGLTLGADVLERCDVIDGDVAKGLQIAGAVASLGAGGASLFVDAPAVASQTAEIGAAVGDSLSAAGTVGGGIATIGQNSSQSAEHLASADAKAAEGRGQAARDNVDDAIARIQQQIKDDQLATGVLARLQKQDSEARSGLLNSMRG